MKKVSTKGALLVSALSVLLCVSMLIGTTFAWFTDTVTSTGNKIQSGTLKVDLELLKDGNWTSIKESREPIFNYDLWEPGYVDVKVLKIENEGSLALKWYAKFVSTETLSDLANAIDVYVCPSATELSYPADRSLAGYTYAGTVADFVNTIETTTKGTLLAQAPDNVAYLGIALKMQESAGNDYQALKLGSFDITILATQLTYENDSFDNQYDVDTEYPYVSNMVTLDGAATEDATFDTEKININVPKELLNQLADEADNLRIEHDKPVVENNDIIFNNVEFYNQNNEIVDLEALGNDKPMLVELNVGAAFQEGTMVDIYHDGVLMATGVEVEAGGIVRYEVLHLCDIKVVENPAIKATTEEQLLEVLSTVKEGDVVDATGVTIDINAVGSAVPGGAIAYNIPGGVTIKNLNVVGSYRGGNYLMFTGALGQEIVFEDCTFDIVGRAMGFGLVGDEGGATSVVYNNCTFKGPIITNFVGNADGVATFNNCTFTKAASGNNYVMAMGGKHVFNGCTFDYTGLTQSNMGTINAATVNAVSESDNTYSTEVILNGCTRINCGTRTYGPSSKLTVK